MIQHLRHFQIDKERWDKAIDASFNGIVYAKSWYLDIVSPEWEALVEDDYKIVFPLTWRKKLGIHYLFPPFFTQQLGIFSQQQSITEEILKNFLNAIPDKFGYVEIHLNHQNKIQSVGFKSNERITHHIGLNPTFEEITKGYSENLRRNIKKANQNSLEVTGDFSVKNLVHLFRTTRGEGIKTLKEGDYLRFEKLVSTAQEKGLVTLTGTKTNNTLSAGALFLKSNHEYIFLFSATNESARDMGAMSFIIDRFIQQHAGEPMNLDFEGSMDKNLSRFYKSFGSTEVVYLQLKKNDLPFIIRWLKK